MLALTIVLHHLALRVKVDTFLFKYFSEVGFLVVSVFFFFSGYGVQKSYITKQESYRKGFLLHRLPTVLIPYVIITALYWLMYFVDGTRYSIKDIIAQLVEGTPIVTFSWYIVTISVFYVVFWVMMTLCKQRYGLMICIGCLWYITYVICCIKMGYKDQWYNSGQLLIFGMWFATYEKRIIRVIEKTYFVFTPATLLLCAVIYCFKNPIASVLRIDSALLLLRMTVAVLFVLIGVLFSLKFAIGNKLLRFLGDISLEIYLLQGLFIAGLRNSIIYIQNDSLWCIMVLAGTIMLAYVLHHIFVPIQKNIDRYIKKGTSHSRIDGGAEGVR